MRTDRDKDVRDVLIIEDESDVRFLLTGLLRKNGFDAHSCASLECGRSELKDKVFDVIILDINLTDGNGLTLLEQRIVPKATKVVVISAHGDMEPRALELGATRFVPKPFSNANILEAIS